LGSSTNYTMDAVDDGTYTWGMDAKVAPGDALVTLYYTHIHTHS